MQAEPLLIPARLPSLSDAARLAEALAARGEVTGHRVRSLLEEIVFGLAVVADQVEGDVGLRRRMLTLRASLDSHLAAAEDIEAIDIAPDLAMDVLRRAAASAQRELVLLSADLTARRG